MAVIIVAIALRPKWALLFFSTAYVISGPVLYVVALARRPSASLAGVSVTEKEGAWDERP